MTIQSKNKTIKYLLKTLKVGFLIIFLLVVSVIMFSTVFVDEDDSKSFLGMHFFIVLSDSMQPEFSAGDLIIVRNVSEDNVGVGDIITFNSIDPFSFNEIITHEIVSLTTYQDKVAYVTKGLANSQDDLYPVPYEKIVGKYLFNIPKAGFVFDYLKTDAGYIIFILIPFVLLISLEVISTVKRIKKDKQVEIEKLRVEKEELEKELLELRKKKNE